jgi:3-oxoacyl-[acyl-carrier protein] reductase
MRVVVTGATGGAGRAVCAALASVGHDVVAVGTDASRLAPVDAAERVVADLADPAAASALAGLGPVDGLVHLVGGWRGGSDPETAAWLRTRLVTTLEIAIGALEPALSASAAARLAILSSTAVTPALLAGDVEPGSAYAAAKLEAERVVARVADRWAGTGADDAAVTWVVRAIGDGERDTPVAAVGDAAVALWGADAPANGARIRL